MDKTDESILDETNKDGKFNGKSILGKAQTLLLIAVSATLIAVSSKHIELKNEIRDLINPGIKTLLGEWDKTKYDHNTKNRSLRLLLLEHSKCLGLSPQAAEAEVDRVMGEIDEAIKTHYKPLKFDNSKDSEIEK